MKHNAKITILILGMFLVTQFIGLYVVDFYSTERLVDGQIIKIGNSNVLPYGMGMDEEEKENKSTLLTSIIFSFIIAILILFFLTHIKAKFILKLWFFIVTVLALGISLTALLPSIKFVSIFALGGGLLLALAKIFKRNFIVHNFSELLIYPGIAAIFVPLLGLWGIIILLVLISVYDMWAVWKSKIMQKMAKFQMEELNIFAGFFIPYASKKQKEKIRKIKEKIKNKKMTKKEAGKKGIKINAAILGGGDVIFPIITSGIVLKTWGVWPAIAVIFGAFVGLGMLLCFSEKKKFYPAMPFIITGMFLAMGVCWLFFKVDLF
jgi:presenilin-like A22 family membrane protease